MTSELDGKYIRLIFAMMLFTAIGNIYDDDGAYSMALFAGAVIGGILIFLDLLSAYLEAKEERESE